MHTQLVYHTLYLPVRESCVKLLGEDCPESFLRPICNKNEWRTVKGGRMKHRLLCEKAFQS